MRNQNENLVIGKSCEVYLNLKPSGRQVITGQIYKVNHSTILVRIPDGKIISRKIERDLISVL